MNIQQMNAAWAQMRRASTLAAYARMAAEARRRQDEGKIGNTAEAAGPKAEEAPKEEPNAEEPETEEHKAGEPVAEEPLVEEPAPAEEPPQDDETVRDSPADADPSGEEEASE